MLGLDKFFQTAGLVFLASSLFLILFSAVFSYVILKTVRLQKTVSDTLKTDSEEYFSSALRELQSWRETALSDMAASVKMVWYRFIIKAHARGTLRSLSNPEGPGWLVYEMKFQGKTGFVDLRTSQDAYRLEFNPPNHPRTVFVSVNGTPLGTITKSQENLTLSESTGYTIGTYERYQIIRKRGWATKTRYGQVELAGRPKIKLCNYFFSEGELSQDGDEPRAVFKDLSWQPTEDEEHWLMTLVAWEIHNSIANTVSRLHFRGFSMSRPRGSRW